MKLEHITLLALVTILCCSCSLNVANGMLAYDTGDTRLGFARVNSINEKTGARETSILMDTKGSVRLDKQVEDEKIVLIYTIMKSAPNMFDRDYLLTQEINDLRQLEQLIKKSKEPKK